MSALPNNAEPLPDRPEPGAAPTFDVWTQPRNADGSYVAIARESLASLTSLRFFAAAYVVVHHLVNEALLASQGAGADRRATWYLALGTQGHIGVTFFFVLSGFILAWCYHAQFARSVSENAPERAERRRSFWFARFARVWPLHAAMFVAFIPIAVMDALTPGGLIHSAWTGALNLTLLHAWVPAGGPDGISDTFNSPSWTLSCEAFFYALFPLIAMLLVVRLRWGIGQLALLASAAWLGLGSLGLAVNGVNHGEWLMRVFPATRLVDFVVGVCIGLIVVQLRQRRTLRNESAPVAASALWTGIELATIAAAIAGPVFVALTRNSLDIPATLTTSWLHLPAFAALIFVMSLERGSISRRALAWRPLIWLGEVSYALYLTHMFLVLAAYKLHVYAHFGTWPTSIALFIAATVVAGVVHERFEKPMRARLVAKRLDRRTAAA